MFFIVRLYLLFFVFPLYGMFFMVKIGFMRLCVIISPAQQVKFSSNSNNCNKG